MSCFLGIIYGMFSLGLVASHFKNITEGKIAGKMAFDIIERTPKILLDDPESIDLTKKQIEGRIEFKGVTFSYPSR